MNLISKTLAALSVAATAFAVPAQAGEPGFDVQMNFRAGVQATSIKDNLGVGTLGFGFEAGWSIDGVNRITCEPGFLYKAGSQYLENAGATARVSGLQPVDPEVSVDSRKNQLQGITLRLAYERAYQGWSLKAGVMLAKLQFRQEYIADVTALPKEDPANPGTYLDPAYHDTYNGVLEESKFSASPFVGVKIPTCVGQSLEVTVLGLNYTRANYVHVAGAPNNSNSLDSVATTSRFVPHVEVAYGFQF